MSDTAHMAVVKTNAYMLWNMCSDVFILLWSAGGTVSIDYRNDQWFVDFMLDTFHITRIIPNYQIRHSHAILMTAVKALFYSNRRQ